MHVVQRPMRVRRRVNLPTERLVVNDVGLGGFNIGKMFSRMVHFTPRSFQPKNIFGAIGSVAAFTATGGLAQVISGKTFGAHSALMKDVGMGITAAAAAAGAVVAFPAIVPAISSGLSTVGSGLTSLFGGAGKLAGSLFGGIFGGRGGGGGGMTMGPQQVYTQGPGYDPNALVQPQSGQLQIPDPNASMVNMPGSSIASSLTPTVYPSMPDPNVAESAAPANPDEQLQSPSAQQFQTINPVTGQPIFPTAEQDYTYYYVGGGVALLGLYYYMTSK